MRLSNSFGFTLFLLLLREKDGVFLLICLFLLITKVFLMFKRILFGKNIRWCTFNQMIYIMYLWNRLTLLLLLFSIYNYINVVYLTYINFKLDSYLTQLAVCFPNSGTALRLCKQKSTSKLFKAQETGFFGLLKTLCLSCCSRATVWTVNFKQRRSPQLSIANSYHIDMNPATQL